MNIPRILEAVAVASVTAIVAMFLTGALFQLVLNALNGPNVKRNFPNDSPKEQKARMELMFKANEEVFESQRSRLAGITASLAFVAVLVYYAIGS